MSAAVLDSHPTLTAVLFGLYEQEPGVFMPISFEDRLTAVEILANRLDPPAPDPRLVSNTQWFLPATPVEYVDVLPFKPPSPELCEFVKTFTIVNERHFDENDDVELFGFGEPPCHSVQSSPSTSPSAGSTPAPCDEQGLRDIRMGNVRMVTRYVHRTTCEHGIDTLFRCGHCILEGKRK